MGDDTAIYDPFPSLSDSEKLFVLVSLLHLNTTRPGIIVREAIVGIHTGRCAQTSPISPCNDIRVDDTSGSHYFSLGIDEHTRPT